MSDKLCDLLLDYRFVLDYVYVHIPIAVNIRPYDSRNNMMPTVTDIHQDGLSFVALE